MLRDRGCRLMRSLLYKLVVNFDWSCFYSPASASDSAAVAPVPLTTMAEGLGGGLYTSIYGDCELPL